MKTNQNQNSIEAHEFYKGKFKNTAQRIYEYIDITLTGLSAFQISSQMNIPISTVTGRLNDLKRANRVKVLCKNHRTKAPESIYICNYDPEYKNEIQPERFSIDEIRNCLKPVVRFHDDLEFYLKQIKK